jgi:hypothetical protein
MPIAFFLLRHFVLQILLLSCFICYSVQAAQASITLNFPDSLSVGKIYLLKPGYINALVRNFVTATACDARGQVKVRPGQLLSLVGNYALTENMRSLKNLPANAFVHLDLRKLEINGADLANISHLTGLRQLELDNTDVDDSGLGYLSNLTGLQNLGLSKSLITGSSLEQLRPLRQLTMLDLGRTRLKAGCLGVLSDLKALTHLRLDECGITDSDLRIIAGLPKLSLLSIKENHRITWRGFVELRRSNTLKTICLTGNKLTDREILALSACHFDRLILRAADLDPPRSLLLKRLMPHTVIEIEAASNVPLDLFAPLH